MNELKGHNAPPPMDGGLPRTVEEAWDRGEAIESDPDGRHFVTRLAIDEVGRRYHKPHYLLEGGEIGPDEFGDAARRVVGVDETAQRTPQPVAAPAPTAEVLRELSTQLARDVSDPSTTWRLFVKETPAPADAERASDGTKSTYLPAAEVVRPGATIDLAHTPGLREEFEAGGSVVLTFDWIGRKDRPPLQYSYNGEVAADINGGGARWRSAAQSDGERRGDKKTFFFPSTLKIREEYSGLELTGVTLPPTVLTRLGIMDDKGVVMNGKPVFSGGEMPSPFDVARAYLDLDRHADGLSGPPAVN